MSWAKVSLNMARSRSREYLMYYRVPGFLAVYDLAPPPTLPLPLSLQQIVFLLSLPVCRPSSLRTEVEGERVGKQIMRWRESLVLYNPLVTTLCQGLQYEAQY